MKITAKEPQIDFEKIVEEINEKYDEVYFCKLDSTVFLYRPLSRGEFKSLQKNDEISNLEKEEVICSCCIVYPENFDFSTCDAGIPTVLCKKIMEDSFLDSVESRINILNYCRLEMNDFDNQVSCIINEAFPQYDIEEIDNWSMARIFKYLSRAEWKLQNLRGLNIDYSLVNEILNKENNIDSEKHDNEKETKAKMTPEELQKIKNSMPEKNLVTSYDEMVSQQETVDSTPVALRPIY